VLGDDPEGVAVEPFTDGRLPRLAGLAAGGLEDARTGERDADLVQRLDQRIGEVLGGGGTDSVLVDGTSLAIE
jgi:hypothetical protein